jgi:hypothetical protein
MHMHDSGEPAKQILTRRAAPKKTVARKAAAKKALRISAPPTVVAPGEEQIRLRAYQFFLERGGVPGDPVADWIRAERDLIAEAQSAPTGA